MEAYHGRIQTASQPISVVRIGDDGYPPLLREIHDPPETLYVRGDASLLRHPLPISVVGTRRMTPYGAAAVRAIVGPAARSGACIVSGLALGIDAAAHAAALENGGRTIAVLAGGVDAPSVGPRTNAALAERIAVSGGALVSERSPGSHSSKMSFPRRNRIIAGIARGTAVIEAAARSGSLITAYLALEAGRDVFAVPGPITSAASEGSNGLLRRGAIVAASADDVLSYYGTGVPRPAGADRRPGGPERKVLDALEDGPLALDAIIATTGLGPRETLASLTLLALDGLVADRGGIFMKN